MRSPRLLTAFFALVLGSGCASTQSMHPAPPPTGGLGPVPDPPPSRVVVHTTFFADGMRAQLDANIPREGSGEAPLVAGKTAPYKWSRKPLAIAFDRGRIVISTEVTGSVQLLGEHSFPIRLSIAGEPVIAADYQARLQSLSVEVHADAPVDRVSRAIEDKIREVVNGQLDAFRLDVRPLVQSAYDRLSKPLAISLGGPGSPIACAILRIANLEAGPTVLAGGFEKDLGIVVLPSIVLPCPAAAPPSAVPAPLPLLANVATLENGPFTVTIPIAAAYDELSRALESAMGGQLHFSKEYPDLFLEKPEVYPSRDTVVIKLLLGGAVKIAGSRMSLAGELFFSGHPRVVDNQIVVPDLELTPGTADGLLKLKVLLDGKAIRDNAQAALRVDLSERIAAAKGKLSTELSFETAAERVGKDGKPTVTTEAGGCVRAEALHTEVTGIYPHEKFLRVYVVVSAQAALYMPCRH